MKILVVCQHYWPEPYPLTDICEELVKKGHDVHVLTDIPNYPMGYIYEGYGKNKKRIENHNGVKIIRAFTIGRRNNPLFRVLNYYSYSIASTYLAKNMTVKYDVVFINQTSPIMMARAGIAYAKKNNVKAVLYCMDLWPASLSVGGVKKSSYIYKIYERVSKKIYQSADEILITSKMFRQYLTELGVNNKKISYMPQYAVSSFEKHIDNCTTKNTIDFMFAGNVGAAQSISTIIDAARILKDMKNVRFHIVGDGSEFKSCKDQAVGLKNVIFYGRQALDEMPKFYAMADAMLVTLTNDPVISLTLPGKVQTYMAAGKPIIGAANGEIPRVINEANCGYCADADNARDLADKIKKFIINDNKNIFGKNARQYYEENFTRTIFMNTLQEKLK